MSVRVDFGKGARSFNLYNLKAYFIRVNVVEPCLRSSFQVISQWKCVTISFQLVLRDFNTQAEGVKGYQRYSCGLSGDGDEETYLLLPPTVRVSGS